jgi:type I restriction enzyme S subunit
MAGEWQKTTVGEFAPFAYGKGLPERHRDPFGDVPVFGSNGIVGFHSKALTSGPTVIIGRKGTVGAVHFSPKGCWPIDTTFFVVDEDPELLRFKYYLLKSLGLDHMNADSAVPGLNREAAHARSVSVPPRPEQRAIAHILGALDHKIELNRRMSETLEAMARALFKSWFMDFDPVRAKAEGRDPGLPQPLADLFPDSFEDSELGEIPKGWEAGTLVDLAILNPEVWTKETRPAEINYVDLSNTKRGRIEAVSTYQAADAPSRAQRVLRPADTIVGTVRPGNGSYALIFEDGLTGSTGFAVLRPRTARYAEFVYLAATAADNIDTLAHLADGAAYPAVRPEVVAATPIVRSSDEVFGRFSRIAGPLLAKRAQNERESRTLAALRDTLLPKLISGELRVKNADRLPAEAR